MGEILAEDQDQSFLMVKKKNDWIKNKKMWMCLFINIS